MSTAVVSGGFPNLYRTDVSGAPVDELADRAVARADVAELLAELTPAVKVEPEHHLINVAAKRALTATEFKQMFYARGDDHFELANVYECHNIASNILASVWGKRQDYNKIGPGIAQRYAIKMTPATVLPVAGNYFIITDAFGISVKFMFKATPLSPGVATISAAGLTAGRLITSWDNTSPNTPALVEVIIPQPGPPAPTAPDMSDAIKYLVVCINWVNSNSVVFGSAWEFTANTISASAAWTLTATVNSNSLNQGIQVHAPLPQIFDPSVMANGRTDTPYNTSRVINYNRLGGRPDDPSGVDMAYGYATDLQRTFFAQFEVMGNLEKDLCVKRDCWTLCSRMSIEDQLYGLAFVAEDCDDICMKVSCARKWSEVEDALAESCLAENNTIGYNDIVDLYINVRVTNANPKAMDTIIRIRFPVKLTRGPDDLGNWNVVASDAADAVLTTGIPYDSIEGGNMQYANASQTEKQGNYQDQQQTQLPTSTAPGNSNNSTDPHDGVPLT
jgi:hypothetical protein